MPEGTTPLLSASKVTAWISILGWPGFVVANSFMGKSAATINTKMMPTALLLIVGAPLKSF
jgi:hypothetical protein